jgi:hypothetical protein
MNLETIEWSLYPSRRNSAAAGESTGLALDMAGYRRRRKSMTHSALGDLVLAAMNESRPITELYVNPLALGVDALRFVGGLMQQQRGREVLGSPLRELVLHCPADFVEKQSATNADDSGSTLWLLERSNIDKVLRAAAAAFKACDDDGVGLSHWRSFQSNVLPADPAALTEFLQSAPGLEELRLGAHQSGLGWDGESHRRHAETIGSDDANAILRGIKSLVELRAVTLRKLEGDGLSILVSGLGYVPSIELEVDFTADLMSTIRQLVETRTSLQELTLRNTGSREVDCGR